jgi:hypothetical protein
MPRNHGFKGMSHRGTRATNDALMMVRSAPTRSRHLQSLRGGSPVPERYAPQLEHS